MCYACYTADFQTHMSQDHWSDSSQDLDFRFLLRYSPENNNLKKFQKKGPRPLKRVPGDLFIGPLLSEKQIVSSVFFAWWQDSFSVFEFPTN